MMKTNIIKIGNSKGIIIPIEVLRRLNLSLKSSVDIKTNADNTILIKPTIRDGWEEDAKKMAMNGDGNPLMEDFFEDETLDWWTWED